MGTYVSSKQYFTIQLCRESGKTSACQGTMTIWPHPGHMSWSEAIAPRKTAPGMTGTGIPKTKDEYMKQMKANMVENEKLLKRQVPIPSRWQGIHVPGKGWLYSY